MSRSKFGPPLVALAICAPVWAAGGHHAVDDAVILAPGECGLESWATHADNGDGLAHLGGKCGVDGIELSVAAEPTRDQGETLTLYGAQLKWAREFRPGWRAGFSVTPTWQTHASARYVGTTMSALLTWKPNEPLAIHLNAGRDLLNERPDQGRNGAAIEWTPHKQWSFVFERYLLNATQFARVGARWFANDRLNFDLSRAQNLAGARPSNWTIGATVSFR